MIVLRNSTELRYDLLLTWVIYHFTSKKKKNNPKNTTWKIYDSQQLSKHYLYCQICKHPSRSSTGWNDKDGIHLYIQMYRYMTYNEDKLSTKRMRCQMVRHGLNWSGTEKAMRPASSICLKIPWLYIYCSPWGWPRALTIEDLLLFIYTGEGRQITPVFLLELVTEEACTPSMGLIVMSTIKILVQQ